MNQGMNQQTWLKLLRLVTELYEDSRRAHYNIDTGNEYDRGITMGAVIASRRAGERLEAILREERKQR